MFVLFGRNSKVKTVRGGRRVVAECPSCGVNAQFHECERESSLNLYVVLDLFSEKTTVYRCTSCGDIFELDEQATAAQQCAEARAGSQSAPATVATAGESPRQRARREREERRQAERLRQERERDAKAREILQQRKKERKEQQIEDELAALKRKLRKG